MKALMLAVALLFAAPIAGLAFDDGATTAEAVTSKASKKTPPPPRLPRNFHGKGRYVVADLDVGVPFTWVATDGDMQMTAGGKMQPIQFSNIISDGVLYTVTYTWPGIARRPCFPGWAVHPGRLQPGCRVGTLRRVRRVQRAARHHHHDRARHLRTRRRA